MDRSEAKFHNTSKKMNNALTQLLEEKEFSQITVLEICKKANVNRSTFYSHYNNTHDLLEELHMSFTNELYKYFSTDDDITENEPDISVSKTVSYLEFIKDRKSFFKTYMSNLNNFKRDEFHSYIKVRVLVPLLEKKGITNETDIDYISQFYLKGIAAIIKEWINNDCADDMNHVAEIIIQCTKLNLM